jgi:hypothetical protein
VVYAIANSALVAPMTSTPVVESMAKSLWLKTAISWYQQPSSWPVPIAMDGPANWPRAAAGTIPSALHGPTLPANAVSSITTTRNSIAFSVAKVGVPVVVKIPYFPNWQAHGATGPYPVTPNLMVVVPTSHRVYLAYGTTAVDWVGRIGTALGLAGLLAIRTPVDPGPQPATNRSIDFSRGARAPQPEVLRDLWWRDGEDDRDDEPDAHDPDAHDPDSDTPDGLDVDGRRSETPDGSTPGNPETSEAGTGHADTHIPLTAADPERPSPA